MISIGCLIYRSPRYCDFVYDSLHRYTPALVDGTAEFYFVANDATPEVLTHLTSKGYRHYVHTNTPMTRERMLARGLAFPIYMPNVYKGFNRIISEASGEYVVTISSDMAFSPGWLEALIAAQDGNSIVSSQLLEGSARANTAAGSIPCDLGYTIHGFDEGAFLNWAAKHRADGTRPGGQYGPMMLPMAAVHRNGVFPEGNVADGNYYGLPGDRVMAERWAKLGTPHITARGSVVYHFYEGEMREDNERIQ
jgi:hypothetical protein